MTEFDEGPLAKVIRFPIERRLASKTSLKPAEKPYMGPGCGTWNCTLQSSVFSTCRYPEYNTDCKFRTPPIPTR
jgi:hypothetical protein